MSRQAKHSDQGVPAASRAEARLTIAPRALTSSAVRENLTGPMEMPSLGSPAALQEQRQIYRIRGHQRAT